MKEETITKQELISRAFAVIDSDVERLKERIETHLVHTKALPEESDDNYFLAYSLAAAGYKQLYESIFCAAANRINRQVKSEARNIASHL